MVLLKLENFLFELLTVVLHLTNATVGYTVGTEHALMHSILEDNVSRNCIVHCACTCKLFLISCVIFSRGVSTAEKITCHMHWSVLSQLCEHASCTVDSNTGREGSLVPRPHVREKRLAFCNPMRHRNEARGEAFKFNILQFPQVFVQQVIYKAKHYERHSNFVPKVSCA